MVDLIRPFGTKSKEAHYTRSNPGLINEAEALKSGAISGAYDHAVGFESLGKDSQEKTKTEAIGICGGANFFTTLAPYSQSIAKANCNVLNKYYTNYCNYCKLVYMRTQLLWRQRLDLREKHNT